MPIVTTGGDSGASARRSSTETQRPLSVTAIDTEGTGTRHQRLVTLERLAQELAGRCDALVGHHSPFRLVDAAGRQDDVAEICAHVPLVPAGESAPSLVKAAKDGVSASLLKSLKCYQLQQGCRRIA
jgi:hypothetical protein